MRSIRRPFPTFLFRLFAVLAAILMAGAARAETLRPLDGTVAAPQTATLSVSAVDALTVGVTPAYGTFSVAPSSLIARTFMNGGAGGLGVADAFNLNSEYSAAAYGGNFSMFGGMAERQSIFAPLSLTAWNMGGSLGYGGFYLRAGVNTTPQFGPLQQTQGWQAGLGFATGPVDFRVTYMMAQTGGFGAQDRELDSQQFSLGGFYRLTSSLRLNADAFLGMHDSRTAGFFTAPPAAGTQPPQGTGARLGVQLRF